MVAEREQAVHHQFSKDGKLAQVSGAPVPSKKDEAKPAAQVVTISGDPVLRFVLIQKGLITASELTEAEATLAATGMLRTDARHT